MPEVPSPTWTLKTLPLLGLPDFQTLNPKPFFTYVPMEEKFFRAQEDLHALDHRLPGLRPWAQNGLGFRVQGL